MSSRRSRSGAMDRDHVQPVVEVLAEAPGGDLVAEVAVGGGDHAHVDVPRLRRADPLTSPSWSTRSSLAWKSADISPISSRKSVPPSARSKQPARAGAPGEGAALVAEELALEHAGRERRAVDGDERRADAVAPVVQQPRHQLLAGPALTRTSTLAARATRRTSSSSSRLAALSATIASGE